MSRRDQIAEVIVQLWADDAGESVEELRTVPEALGEALTPYLDALLPLVDRLCAEAAADALRSAANEWQYLTTNSAPAARFLRTRAANPSKEQKP